MPNLVEFVQLGVAGVAIVAIVAIVKSFLKFVEVQEKNFVTVITNHMSTSDKAMNKLERANTESAAATKLLLEFLKANGFTRKK